MHFEDGTHFKRETVRRSGRNLRSNLKRRRRCTCPMRAYDSLPSELRAWLAEACLPWSPSSALKIWNRSGGSANAAEALSRLDAIEQSMLRKDSVVWTGKECA